MRFKRQNTIWLSFLLGMIGLAVLGGATPAMAGILIGLFAVAAGLALFPRPEKIMETIQQTANRPARGASPEAREATARAIQRGSRIAPDLALMDVGLIASGMTDEGMVMRRADEISKDDQGARPFIVLKVDPSAADRRARLRFEMIDHTGKEQYIHEMDVYLRDGEMNILADTHLPLDGNDRIEGMGQWDLRVYLDGELTAMHGFSLSPSYEERRNRLGNSRRHFVMSEDQDASTEGQSMRLEDLLRQQNRSNQRGER